MAKSLQRLVIIDWFKTNFVSIGNLYIDWIVAIIIGSSRCTLHRYSNTQQRLTYFIKNNTYDRNAWIGSSPEANNKT